MFRKAADKKFYITLFGVRFVFEEGKYMGKYHVNLDHIL